MPQITLHAIAVDQGLLYPALRKAGVTLGPGRTPSPAQFQDAIGELNRLLSSLSIDPYFVYSQDILTFPLTGKTSYTIGIDAASPTADFAVAAPVAISFANYVSGSLRVPLSVLTPQIWSSIAMQTLAGIPSGLYYDHAYPIGNIYLYPQPAAGNLELYVWHTIPKAAAPTDLIGLPPGYDDAIVLNLACRLAPQFQRPVDPLLRADARESLMRVLSLNAPRPVLEMPWACGCHGSGNWETAVLSGGGGGGGGVDAPMGPEGPAGAPGMMGMTGAQGPSGVSVTVQDEGTDLPTRWVLDFVGAGVTATDDGPNNRTIISIPGAPAAKESEK